MRLVEPFKASHVVRRVTRESRDMKSVSSCNGAAEAAHNASGDFLRLIDG